MWILVSNRNGEVGKSDFFTFSQMFAFSKIKLGDLNEDIASSVNHAEEESGIWAKR